MKRRALLAAVGTGLGVASAGCLGVLEGEKPIRLRALPADGNETDVRCTLDPAMVESHPALRDVLRTAASVDDDRIVGRDISRERADAIDSALQQHCEEYRGLYRYREEWFFVSMIFKDGEDAARHHGHNHTHTG